MGFSVTALELVNRVHLLRRASIATVTSFNETEDTATLNAINHAIDEVMSEQRWDFNIRNDGQITLRAKLTGATLTTDGSTASGTLSKTGLVQDDVTGGYISSIVATGSTKYAGTSLRVVSSADVSGSLSAVVTLGTIPDEAMLAVSAEVFYSDYVLPDTVDSLIRASYQEYPLTLNQVDPKLGYFEIHPKMHIQYGTPEQLSVGSYGIPSYQSSATAPGPAMKLSVWPVPDDNYILNYSYYYRHPQLSAETDTLVGVPPDVVSRIVHIAAGDMILFYDKDQRGALVRANAKRSVSDVYDSQGGQRYVRKPIHGWESSRQTRSIRSIFGGRLLGGG